MDYCPLKRFIFGPFSESEESSYLSSAHFQSFMQHCHCVICCGKQFLSLPPLAKKFEYAQDCQFVFPPLFLLSFSEPYCSHNCSIYGFRWKHSCGNNCSHLKVCVLHIWYFSFRMNKISNIYKMLKVLF